MSESIGQSAVLGAHVGVAFFQILSLAKQCCLALEEDLADHNPIYVAVGQTAEPLFEPTFFELGRCKGCRTLARPGLTLAGDALCQVGALLGAEGQACEVSLDLGIQNLLPNTRGQTSSGVAAVVDVALLELADETVAAVFAAKQPAEKKVVLDRPGIHLASQHRLHAIEQRLRDHGSVNADESLPGAQPNEPHVEGILQQLIETGPGDGTATAGAEPKTFEFCPEGLKRVASGCVALEGVANQGRSHRIEGFGLPAPLIDVPERRRKRVEPLLQAPVETLPDFLTEIPDVVGRHHRLDVGRDGLRPRARSDGPWCHKYRRGARRYVARETTDKVSQRYNISLDANVLQINVIVQEHGYS